MEKPKYPTRGWLQGLVEGSATLDETNEAIQGFITHAEDRGWQEGYKVATGYGHEVNRKGSLTGLNNFSEYSDKDKDGGAEK